MIFWQKIKEKINLYKELSKSGIVTLVLISVFGGFLIGQSPEFPFHWARMWLTLAGILFLASGSSALNQLQEQEQDAQMPRTASRPLPSGRMSRYSVSIFVGVSLTVGLGVLSYLGLSLFLLGIMAVILYNGLYTLWWKKHWAFAAIPGAVPGALPVLMGHASASGSVFHPGGLYLFFLLFFWQMPHFWTLALRYQKDYAQGGFPTLPVKLGEGITLIQITVWCLAYMGLAMIAPFFIKVGWIYLIPTLLMNIGVLWELYSFAIRPEGQSWLRFFLWVNFSLIAYLSAACVDLWSMHLPYFHHI